MEIIRSKDNSKIKNARKLLTRKGRKQSQTYLIEGFHLLEEAQKSGAAIRQIFVAEGKIEEVANALPVSDEVLKSLSDTGTPQGVVAEVSLAEPEKGNFEKVLILENVQDPGNVGTMVRTADAAGFSAVYCVGETADIYSPKVMRAMQGSHFHLPIFQAADLEKLLKSLDLPVLTTTLSKNSIFYKEVKAEKFALIMGNEGQGVSRRAVELADKLVHIDMPGQAESLNVAVAAGILMFSL